MVTWQKSISNDMEKNNYGYQLLKLRKFPESLSFCEQFHLAPDLAQE